MGFLSLFLFTLLGGLACGAYVFETFLQKKRPEGRPWLVPLVVVVLFVVGLIAATTHVSNIGRVFESLSRGTINLGAGMVHEVVIAGCFSVLAIIDLIVVAVKKCSPYALRVITAIVAVICIASMGLAYIDVYGNPVWCNAPATILTFTAGSLAAGLALWALLDKADYTAGTTKALAIVFDAVLAVALCLEIVAFTGAGESPIIQIIALVAAIAALVVTLAASKVKNKTALAAALFVILFVGVALSRYAFYATSTVL